MFRAEIAAPVSGEIKGLCERVASGFNEEPVIDITDRFFAKIETDPTLSAEYKRLEKVFGQRSLNAQIGRWVREKFKLDNGQVVPATLSGLITAYTTHSKSQSSGEGHGTMGMAGM